MKELREKLHEAIDEYGLTDKRTVAISQELDKLVCEAQKLIIKKGLSYIEAIEKEVKKYENIEVSRLEIKYPQGAEKQLIYACTKREVPSGGLPMDVGVVVNNVEPQLK